MKRPTTATDIQPRAKKSIYPEPFATRMNGRTKRVIGDYFGLENFGVNLTTLEAGACSALLHKHTTQDEFIYVLKGTLTLVTEEGEDILTEGMCVGFPKGGGAHMLKNNGTIPAVYLEVGDRTTGDQVTYPQDDLKAVMGEDGQWAFTKKDGTPH